MNNYKFIPAISIGPVTAGLFRNDKFRDNTSYDYWNWRDEFRYPYFLITAGHFYKNKNIAKIFKFFDNSDTTILGDSGGFQIATGAIKWKDSLRYEIFEWLENNTTVAPVLDIPAISKTYLFDTALELSICNFKYFADNQTGKTKFLNVLQGFDLSSYMKWHDNVKKFINFHGWAIGNTGKSVLNLYNAIYVLLLNNEHRRSKIWHFFGVSSPINVLMLCHLQNGLNKLGCDLQIFSDSSSINDSRFGSVTMSMDYKKLVFNRIHIPYLRENVKNLSNEQKEIYKQGIDGIPEINLFDKRWKMLINNDDLYNFNSTFVASLSLKNLFVYINAFNDLQKFSKLPIYYRKDIFDIEYATMGNIIEELVLKTNNIKQLENFYKKNIIIFKKYYNKFSYKDDLVTHDFFNDLNKVKI